MKKSAFTLVEMLIVIAVFGTGILTVLYGIAQTLGNQDKTNVQITSSFLAREGIELMYNLRDSNYRKKLPWNCIFTSIDPANLNADNICEVGQGFTGGSIFKIAIDPDKYLTVEKIDEDIKERDFDKKFEEFQLYYHTGPYYNSRSNWPPIPEGFRYSHEENDHPLRFARYIILKSVMDGETELPQDKILKIESHVLYKK